jgi:hypothetical protein
MSQGAQTFCVDVQSVIGRCVVLETTISPKLQVGDRLRIERVLETILAPGVGSPPALLGYLSADIGIAEVLYVGTCAVLARYSGKQPIRTGDLATLLES